VLVRHAHAEWPTYSGRDFDRPLTPRGEQDAHTSAQAIRAAGLSPVWMLASPARRTRQTAAAVAAVLGLPPDRLLFVDALYNASARVLETELLRVAPAGAATVLVAHNPGITDLARLLSGDPQRRPLLPAEWASFPLPSHTPA
jgi:phosphohistidine phosphatase